jgi:hypothetical protein
MGDGCIGFRSHYSAGLLVALCSMWRFRTPAARADVSSHPSQEVSMVEFNRGDSPIGSFEHSLS